MAELEIANLINNTYINLPEQENPNEQKKNFLIYYPKYVHESRGWIECDEECPPRGSIYMNKENKYIYFYKEDEPNRYFRYDLSTNAFERVNIYKTREDKVSPVKIPNLRKWFSKYKIITDNSVFARIFLYNKANRRLSSYKNPVRYIEAFQRYDASAIEEWYNAGILLDEVETIFKRASNNEFAYGGYHRHSLSVKPKDFEKSMLKIIKTIKYLSFDTLYRFKQLDEKTLFKYEKLYKMAQTPEYEDVFKFSTYNGENDIFDFQDYSAERARTRILAVIDEFNLDIEALCRFLNRLRRVEGCDIEDLTDGFHYRDYLRMEKELNNQNLTKIDKYPKNWLTTFRRTKRNYDDMKKQIDEKKFNEEVSKHKNLEYQDKKYSIILPEESSDVRREGAGLKHCVASYVDRIANGQTCIVFCRENFDIDEPYVTIEVKNNRITQAYGYQDSKPDVDALKFLAKWAKQKNLTLAWKWEKDFRRRRGV